MDSSDIPVSISSLEVDGVRPSVGDQVEVNLGGTVRKIVDETVFVTPETVNGEPMAEKAQSSSDEDMVAQMQAMETAGGGY